MRGGALCCCVVGGAGRLMAVVGVEVLPPE